MQINLSIDIDVYMYLYLFLMVAVISSVFLLCSVLYFAVEIGLFICCTLYYKCALSLEKIN